MSGPPSKYVNIVARLRGKKAQRSDGARLCAEAADLIEELRHRLLVVRRANSIAWREKPRAMIDDTVFDVEVLRRLQAEADYIDCSELAEAVGYPHPYTEAERVLQAEGWRYDIGIDAWCRKPSP